MRRFTRRNDWLAARRIGSSDAPTILGLTKRSPWDVWERLVHNRQQEPVDDDEDDDPTMARGRDLEPMVLRRYAAETGQTVRRAGLSLFEREEWATATPDGFGSEVPIVEAKTDRNRWRWGEPTTIERWVRGTDQIVRKDYYMQVQHQMFVLDVEMADLAVLLPSGSDPFLFDLRVYRILRDDEVVEQMADTLHDWWHEHVVKRVPPALDGSQAAGRYLAGLPRTGGTREATHEERQWIEAMEAFALNEKFAEQQRKVIGQTLVALAREHKKLTFDGGSLTIVENQGRETVDVEAMLRDHPELAGIVAEYRRRSAPFVTPRVYRRAK